jgi:hypothetical protein
VLCILQTYPLVILQSATNPSLVSLGKATKLMTMQWHTGCGNAGGKTSGNLFWGRLNA